MNTAIHRGTANLQATDARSLPIRQVAYLRKNAGDVAQSLISRGVHNLAGHLIEQWDPRLSIPSLSNVHRLSGDAIQTHSVDAGKRLILPGLAGEELRRWDARGNHWRTRYDDQLRAVAIDENDQENVETFTYADPSANPAFNLRGQMIKQVDQSGTLEPGSFSLQGSPLSESRTIAGAGIFSSNRRYSPLGDLLIQTDSGGHRQRLHYDIAGQLKQVVLQLSAGESQTVLQDAQYNAAGQITMQTAGNGVISRWTYCPADGRLTTLKSGKPDEALQQNLHYFYDRMDNILRIEDHTLAPVYFANQRVDGHREFIYDSLYRVTCTRGFEGEVPNLESGLPELIKPVDPGRRYGYVEDFTYDDGNNLIELRHQREGNNFTLRMRIDPESNRGVRWKTGDPEPDFKTLFDPHGNQSSLQDGAQALIWNAWDQLEKVTLLTHSNGLADDGESYLYSQGERVCKRHVTHTRSMTHSREVLYLPGLDIHTRDDGRVLHVITLPLAFGSVRCLHWASGGPGDLEPDQLRYSLDDHLGSCTLELDRHGALISLEFYYAFGGTAWWAARSEVEADYKTIRYSGKEMDCSGLYYYGARYYAPWLWRWISPDPAGDVDGLNLYAMVNNNPIVFTDSDGRMRETPEERAVRKTRSEERQRARAARSALNQAAYKHTQIVKLSAHRARDAQRQILNHGSAAALGSSTAIRVGAHVAGQVFSYGVGIGIGIGTAALGVAAGPVGVAAGLATGIAAKKAVSFGVDWASERAGLSTSVKLKSGKLDPQRIISKGEYKTMDLVPYASGKLKGVVKGVMDMNRKGLLKGGKEGGSLAVSVGLKVAGAPMASEMSGGLSVLLGLPEIFHEVMGAAGELTPEKIAKLDANINGLIGVLQDSMNNVAAMFAAHGIEAINTFSYIPSKFHKASGDTVESLTRMTDSAINELRNTQKLLHAQPSRVAPQ
ncbi:RHS repeat-associated core domain-containing protein [Pseudomonas sp. B14-6]|uniref:RHS repeat-associated core domain-containing protein n=1 Tax=Pseudomonas sp. B14-6 TaxID=2738843 RepID=UPI00155ED1CA|nr:RHS repeat-associated core domain-containing protein [Pseudomonas sp. B14-6]QKG66538.1 RHS repeat-associated core domain-containing protein [Pseudomonas sp. B14-6]